MNKYLILTIIILFVWAFFIEPNLIVIKRYKSEKFKNKKVVFVSDFHISKGDKGRLKRIVNLINKQKPDFVISGGDYIKGHAGKTSMDIEKIAEELSKINAPVYSVLGNHDGWYDKYKVKTALEKYGITVLSNSSKEYEGIDIAGVEDLQTGMPNIENALAGTVNPRILVSHTPDIYYDVKEDVDLVLAGHVDGGQVRLPFIGSMIVPSEYGTKFACGDYDETGNRMIVTKGLGTSLLPVRFLTVPEIVVIESD